jgi:hypothetical protein
MSSTKFTIAQIIELREAFNNCQKTELTWDDAKPYLVAHVRATGTPIPLSDKYPGSMSEINEQGLALSKADVMKLVELCYGLEMNVVLDLRGWMPFSAGVSVLKKWARKTLATECPLELKRYQNHVYPSAKLVALHNFASGSFFAKDGIDIFSFNFFVNEFGRKFDYVTAVFDPPTGWQLRAFYNRKEDRRIIFQESATEKAVLHYCELCNKK